MSSKKKSPATPTADLQTLKIGTRVRCTDDGVQGRIAWANGISVKIRWDDGEQVTWRRDSLAGRPIEILDAEQAGDDGPAPSRLPQCPLRSSLQRTKPSPPRCPRRRPRRPQQPPIRLLWPRCPLSNRCPRLSSRARPRLPSPSQSGSARHAQREKAQRN